MGRSPSPLATRLYKIYIVQIVSCVYNAAIISKTRINKTMNLIVFIFL